MARGAFTAALALALLPRAAPDDACPLAPRAPRGDVLRGGDERGLPAALLPGIGNGYAATQIGAAHFFIAGVYTGAATSPSHRAALPSPLALGAGGDVVRAELRVRDGAYARERLVRTRCGAADAVESCVEPAGALSEARVEEVFYAHRALRHVLVAEFTLLGGAEAGGAPRADAAHGGGGGASSDARDAVWLEVGDDALPAGDSADDGGGGGGGDGDDSGDGDRRVRLRVAPLRQYAVAGAREAGFARGAGAGARIFVARPAAAPSADVDAAALSAADCDAARAWAEAEGVPGARAALRGCGAAWRADEYAAREPELPGGETPIALVAVTAPDASDGAGGDVYSLRAGARDAGVTRVVIAAAVTTLDLPAPPASRAAARAALLCAAGAQYEAARALARAGTLFALHATAWREGAWAAGVEVAEARGAAGGPFSAAGALTNASLYALLSAVRADWPFGLGPGGLSSNGYNGHSCV